MLPRGVLVMPGLCGAALRLEEDTVPVLGKLVVRGLASDEVRDMDSRRSPCWTNCRIESWLSPPRILWKMDSASSLGRVRRRSYTCCSDEASPCRESNFLLRAWMCVSFGSASNLQ